MEANETFNEEVIKHDRLTRANPGYSFKTYVNAGYIFRITLRINECACSEHEFTQL